MCFKTVLKMCWQRQENTRTQGTLTLQIYHKKKALVLSQNGLLVLLLDTTNFNPVSPPLHVYPRYMKTRSHRTLHANTHKRAWFLRAWKQKKYKYPSTQQWVKTTQNIQQNITNHERWGAEGHSNTDGSWTAMSRERHQSEKWLNHETSFQPSVQMRYKHRTENKLGAM